MERLVLHSCCLSNEWRDLYSIHAVFRMSGETCTQFHALFRMTQVCRSIEPRFAALSNPDLPLYRTQVCRSIEPRSAALSNPGLPLYRTQVCRSIEPRSAALSNPGLPLYRTQVCRSIEPRSAALSDGTQVCRSIEPRSAALEADALTTSPTKRSDGAGRAPKTNPLGTLHPTDQPSRLAEEHDAFKECCQGHTPEVVLPLRKRDTLSLADDNCL